MFNKQDVAHKIKLARLKKNLSQIDLSKMTGISNSLISNIECGYRKVRIDHIYTIANALDLSIDDFLVNEIDERPKYIAKNIKLLRLANGWSQSDLSKISDLTVESISHYENGQVPGVKVIDKFAKAFCVDHDHLIYDETIDFAAAVIKRCLVDNDVDLDTIDSVQKVKHILEMALSINKLIL